MNVNYFRVIVAVTAVFLFTSMPVRAFETVDVRRVSGEIGWIDPKLGKLQIKSSISGGAVGITDFRISQQETRVTDPTDKKFLTVDDLRAGQYITVDVIDGQEEKIAQKITVESSPVSMIQKTDREVVALRFGMRKLWEDHITYTRNYIISALAELGDKEAIAKRLLRNQDEIGEAIAPYYGEEAGRKLAELLQDHILIATEVVKTAQMDKSEELARAQTKWNANADDISTFLSDANPRWAKDDMTAMLHKHLEYTTQEVVSRLKKDWASDIEAYDQGHHHMLMFADVLTEGIVKQFPEKFTQP